jgi:uncharacterized protein (DUF1015 family)
MESEADCIIRRIGDGVDSMLLTTRDLEKIEAYTRSVIKEIKENYEIYSTEDIAKKAVAEAKV